MKASELRIGNWVNYQVDDECENVQIDVHELHEISEGWDDYKPIPLTEEWLVKFGFKGEHIGANQGSFKNYRKGYLIYNSHHKAFWYEGLMLRRTPLDFVHQLQNLYHALTGEELEIKDNAST